MNHSEIVDKVVNWLKRYKRPLPGKILPNCSLVVKELMTGAWASEIPDVLGWDGWHSTLIEVKTNHADFLNDAKKRHKHFSIGMGEYRFYCCPMNIIHLSELPEKYGLLYINEKNGRITLIKNAEEQEADIKAERRVMLSIIRRLRGEYGNTDRIIFED